MIIDAEGVQIMKRSKRGNTFNKMDWMKHSQQKDLQTTIKHGLILYVVLAMLIIPSGICSQGYHIVPAFEMPDVAPEAPVDIAPLPDQIGEVPLFGFEYNQQPAPATKRPLQFAEAEKQEKEIPEHPFHDDILRASRTYEVDVALIRAIIFAESNNNPQAVSHRGAQGLMQLMPHTAKSLGVEDSFNPAMNIDGGVRYFKQLLNRFSGDVRLALAAYNAGSRYVHKYGGVPPFGATKRYIKKVLRYHKQFQTETASGQTPDPAV